MLFYNKRGMEIIAVGVIGIWMAVPIGWALADVIGIIVYLRKRT